jgi:hypothetical protein
MAASAKPVIAKHREIASTMPPNPDQTSRLLDALHTYDPDRFRFRFRFRLAPALGGFRNIAHYPKTDL